GRAGGLGVGVLLGFVGGLGGRRQWRRLLAARQLVADRDLALAVDRARAFLARLARPHDAALRIEAVRGLGDAVVVEVGGELDAGASRADDGRDDRFDLLAQAPLVGSLAFVGG